MTKRTSRRTGPKPGVKPVALLEPSHDGGISKSPPLRHADGTFARMQPVALPEPGSTPQGEHNDDDAWPGGQLSVVEFVERVTPDQPRDHAAHAQLQRDDEVAKRNQWLYPVLITFVFLWMCGLVLLAWYDHS